MQGGTTFGATAANDEESDNPQLEGPQEPVEIPYPELPTGSEYLLALFHSAGSATPTGMGLTPLSWQEIESFVRCNGLEDSVTPWELSTIRKMSEAYCSEYQAASDKYRRPPYIPTVDADELDREAIANKVMNVLSQYMKKK